jgi:hypothetical protein
MDIITDMNKYITEESVDIYDNDIIKSKKFIIIKLQMMNY